jgi:hypothetical protein
MVSGGAPSSARDFGLLLLLVERVLTLERQQLVVRAGVVVRLACKTT